MIEIIPATMDHAKVLFDWRNDPLTKEMSRNQDAVEWGTHINWLAGRLSRPHLYIATIDGCPVGTFRVDGEEISYTVAPEHRGKGVGLAMLCHARARFGPLRAEIFERNIASIKIAKRAGHHVRVLVTHSQT
jgi:RimJ/RimL family protein N-acetyltransferase